MRSHSLLRRIGRLPHPERAFRIWDLSVLDSDEVNSARELAHSASRSPAEEAMLRSLLERCCPGLMALPCPGDLLLDRFDMAL